MLGRISRGQFSPVYLLSGPESYLIDEIVGALQTALVSPGDDWNVDSLRADEIDGSGVVGRANTLPMGKPYRYVRVGGVDAWKEKDQAPLVAYFDNPSPTTVLVMTATKVDARTKFAKAAGKAGVAARFETLRERDLPPVLTRIAKKQGKGLKPRAAQMLIARCGESLQVLASELAKLALFVGDASEITVEAVAEAAAGEGSANIFALCDAVGAGDTDQALRLLESELAAGGRSGPIRVTAMLARHIRLLMRAREARGNLAAALGLPPFIADQYGRQSGRFSRESLEQAHQLLYEADFALKGGSRVSPEHVIERVVMNLTAL